MWRKGKGLVAPSMGTIGRFDVLTQMFDFYRSFRGNRSICNESELLVRLQAFKNSNAFF